MNQVKMKFDVTQAQTKSFKHYKLFRTEVIWMQCFHWPNIATCGKYPCHDACVIPERYSFSLFCNANASTSKIRLVVFALVLTPLIKIRLKVIPLKLFYYQTFLETWRNEHLWYEHYKNAIKIWGHRACLRVSRLLKWGIFTGCASKVWITFIQN